MKKITIDIPKEKQIEINGQIFTILKGDAEVFMRAAEMTDEFSKLTGLDTGNTEHVKRISDCIKKTIGYTDEVLGKGAVKKITGGKPVGLLTMIEIMKTVCSAVIEEYSQAIEDRYE